VRALSRSWRLSTGDAAAEPGHAAGRADRRPGTRTDLREPRLPPRRRGPDSQPLRRKRWIACRLRFRGWRRGPLQQPGRFTELFFLDEATAFSAGHRPCALCRRDDYRRFVTIWQGLHAGEAGADAIDARLHAERVAPGTRSQLHHEAPLDELPDGAFVLRESAPHLVRGRRLLAWSPAGYVGSVPRRSEGRALVITPPSLVSVLREGWTPVVPLFHPSAL